MVDAAVAAATDCDVFLAVGTSLTVHPAAGLVDLAAAPGRAVVVVNAEPTPYDDDGATSSCGEPIGTALPRLVARRVTGAAHPDSAPAPAVSVTSTTSSG